MAVLHATLYFILETDRVPWYTVARMKQQLVNSYSDGSLDDFADLDAWEGYEFWSIQMEAQMEPLSESTWPRSVERNQTGFVFEKERHGDVLPF
jgi:hypothetical protein